MNRRYLLQAGAISLVSLIGMKRAPVFGQTPEASPESSPTPPYDRYCDGTEGWLVFADMEWVNRSAPDKGVIAYSVDVIVYETEEQAKSAFATFPEYMDGYVRNLTEGSHLYVGERKRLLVPIGGEQRAAETLDVISEDGAKSQRVVAIVRNGRANYRVFAIGYEGITLDTIAFIGSAFHYQEVDPTDDESVIALLPSVYEMPAGFSLDEAYIQRDGETTYLKGEAQEPSGECVRPFPPVASTALTQ